MPVAQDSPTSSSLACNSGETRTWSIRLGRFVFAVMQVGSDPVGPPCSAKLLHHAQLLLLSIEVASNKAGAPAGGPHLIQGHPDGLAELLRLPNHGEMP